MTTLRNVLTLSAVGVGAALVGSGCAPIRDDVDPGPEGSARMAVLTSGDDGFYDVSLLDMSGNLLTTVDANLAEPVGISATADGSGFLVTVGYSQILRVDLSGETTPFNTEPIGTVYRTYVSGDDGTTTTSGEYEATRLDEEGNVIETLSLGTQYCWMDAGEGPTAGSAAMLDVFGPTIAVWDGEDGFEPLASNVGYSSNVLGSDDSGNYYLGSSYDQNISVVSTDGEVRSLGSLSQMGVNAYGVKALESAGSSGVLALVDGNNGSAIVEIGQDGQAREIVNAAGRLWVDMVVF